MVPSTDCAHAVLGRADTKDSYSAQLQMSDYNHVGPVWASKLASGWVIGARLHKNGNRAPIELAKFAYIRDCSNAPRLVLYMWCSS